MRLSKIKSLCAFIGISSIITLLAAPQALAGPTANADTITTGVNQSITFNPMQNDGSDNGTWIFLHWVTQPDVSNRGTTTFTQNSVTYTPPNNFSGTARFWYSLEDSAGQRTGAHIFINIGEGEASSPYPTANSDNLTTDQNTPLIISPLVNDSGDNLKVTFVNPVSTQGSQQRIIGDTQISYTPSIWASGEDSFWYRITDSQGRVNAAKVTVSVTGTGAGAYPTAGSDNYTVDRNSTNNTLNVLANDTGTNLQFDTVYSYSQNGGRTFNNGNSIRYDAPTNFSGTDEFWYSIKDSIGRVNAARVRIEVNEDDSNNPPGTHPDIVKVIDVAGRNPGGASWADSYSVGDQCFMASTFDHGIGDVTVSTPRGNMKIRDLNDLMGGGPGQSGRPLYNDIQCGNGPANTASDETDCPGRVDIGREGCGHIGPKWDLSDI